MPVFVITTNVFLQPGRARANCNSISKCCKEEQQLRESSRDGRFFLLHREGHVFQSYSCTRTDQGHPCISFPSTRPICVVFTYLYWSFSISSGCLLQTNISQKNRKRKFDVMNPRIVVTEPDCPQRLGPWRLVLRELARRGRTGEEEYNTVHLHCEQEPLHLCSSAHRYQLTF